MPRKKKENIDFPIFSVLGDKYFDEEVESAVQLRLSIDELSGYLQEINDEMGIVGSRLNFYINNIIKRPQPFNYLDEVIIFDDEYYACIYSLEEIEKIVETLDLDDCEDEEEIEEELIKHLPKTTDRYKFNDKQTERCLELINDYDDLYSVYEYTIFNVNECTDSYNEIIESVKESLADITLLTIAKEDEQFALEPFDETKHELLISQNSNTSKWQFIYVRKEDKDKFQIKKG